MRVDINQFSEQELRELNHKIVKRLRFLQHAHAHDAMLKFNIGDTICFESDHGKIIGVIAKFNKKTVTIISNEGVKWNVSPSLLSEYQMHNITPKGNVIEIVSNLKNRNQHTTQVSRNAPCLCGSGKKYKRCCLKKGNSI
jgi:hypothetical protein